VAAGAAAVAVATSAPAGAVMAQIVSKTAKIRPEVYLTSRAEATIQAVPHADDDARSEDERPVLDLGERGADQAGIAAHRVLAQRHDRQHGEDADEDEGALRTTAVPMFATIRSSSSTAPAMTRSSAPAPAM
jgi:hypothetical protein